MTSRIFLIWSIFFTSEVNERRRKLAASIGNIAYSRPCYLFVDGHKSRLNAYAIEILFRNNIMVIVLPAHSSHITQPFDVGLWKHGWWSSDSTIEQGISWKRNETRGLISHVMNSLKSSSLIPGNKMISDNVRLMSFGMDLTVWTQMMTFMLKWRSFFNSLHISVSFDLSNIL